MRVLVVVAAVMAPATAVAASTSTAVIVTPTDDPNPASATFEGQRIDLAKGWGRASACAVTASGTTCYRSEAQMEAALGGIVDAADGPSGSAGFVSAAITCGSTLRLYDGGSYTGNVLSVAIRWTYINLANYGFDNRTSSYKVGACEAEFFSGSSGSGGIYPGATWAWAQSPSMCCGWDGLVSSVYIF